MLTLLGYAHVFAEGVIRLPLKIHLVENLPMEKRGVEMHNWITKHDIEARVLPEVNYIWRTAKIKFYLDEVVKNTSPDEPKKEKHIAYLTKASRDSEGKADPKRVKKLKKLVDWSQFSPNAINVFVVPYLGEGSQGIASPKQRRIYIAQWSDKTSRGRQPPVQFPLIERRPYKNGSFSRTLAHELGHVLGLKHPDKRTQTQFSLLMGGKKKGYVLSNEDVRTARKRAKALVVNFNNSFE